MGTTTGERGKELRFPTHSAEEWEQLRAQAAAAPMPAELAAGQQVELVDASTIAGVKLDSVYGLSLCSRR